MRNLPILSLSLLCLFLCLCWTLTAQNTFTVNVTDDLDDSVCDGTHCSLREAILAANANIGPDTIHFNIPGPGAHTIQLDTLLPPLRDHGTVIDATSQPGNFPMAGLVILDGTNAGVVPGSTISGITFNINTTYHELYGLQIQNFERYGVYSYADFCIIGGPDKGNVIISNLGGIILQGRSSTIQSNYIGTDLDFNQGLGNLSHGIQLNSSLAGGAEGAIVGGDFALKEGNIIVNNRGNGIGAFGADNGIIQGNYIGKVPGSDDNYGNTEDFCTNCAAIAVASNHLIIGGSGTRANIIANNRLGIYLSAGSEGFPVNSLIRENSISCNVLGGISMSPESAADSMRITPPPNIDLVTDEITGRSMSGDTIELFMVDEQCGTETPCQGKDFLGRIVADVSGNWSFPTPAFMKLGDRLTATAKNGGRHTSVFASCYIILPDECLFAQPLTLNNSPCGSSGVVLDLKQMSDSSPAPTSSCDDSYQGKDAWFKVGVPNSGNFLVRTNLNNTVTPVIEVYTGCGNIALSECQVLDSLPNAMIFENYTPGDTLYLRVWDKNNEIVDSENTALLHLTAHVLAADPADWEICDFEDLTDENPTNLIRKEPETFILSFESTATQGQIEQTTASLLADGLELKNECRCGSQPTQLWEAKDPVTMEGDKKRVARTRGDIDTTNYNYIFETLEFQVNSYAIGQQYDVDVAMDEAGNFVMTWRDEQRGHNYGRVYKNSGNPVSVEFQIGSSNKTQYATSVEMLDNGDFIAVWHELDETTPEGEVAVYGRLFNADGSPKAPPFDISIQSANTASDDITAATARYGANARVATNSSNQFVVVWHAGKRIYAQRLDEAGGLIGDIIDVGATTTIGTASRPAVDMNDNSAFIVTWMNEDGNKSGVYARRYNSTGQSQGGSFLVNSTMFDEQSHPDIALDNNGSFIIVWESFTGGAVNYDIFMRRYNTQGQTVGGDFRCNSHTPNAQRNPSIALFNDGKFLVVWSSLNQDGFAEGIFAKMFNPGGTPIPPGFDTNGSGATGPEFRMNAYHIPQQKKPRTASNGSSLFIGAWEDGANDGSFEGIFAQRYEMINSIFYPIGTATPAALLGDVLEYQYFPYHPEPEATEVRVAVLDTGIDSTHPHFQNSFWQNPEENDEDNCVLEDDIGYDFVNGLGAPTDLDGHGTQVNGILRKDFTEDLKMGLMNLKFYELGKGDVFDAICGIYYAVDNGADVLNLSWGFEASEEPLILKNALQYAADHDVLIVTSAGNTNKNNDVIDKYPANLDIPNIIVVTAYQYKSETDEVKLANYASYGNTMVDIAAYGYVEAPMNGGGKTPTAGTSLAAPAVARTAATIRGLYPSLTAIEIKECIISSAQAVADLSDKVVAGGILNHEAALECAQGKARLSVSPVVFLQGASEPVSGFMRDDLRSLGLIPLVEPFTDLGYTQVGSGGESTTADVFEVTGPDAIVDWVFVELRSIAAHSIVVATRPALLQRDGDVVDLDGISPVTFANVPTEYYHVVVKHRNHIGVMSATPFLLSDQETVVDFTSNFDQTFGGVNGIAELGNGLLGMFSGDFNRNAQVQNTDYGSMVLTIGLSGYEAGDLDLNGQVQNSDLQLYLLPNIGRGQGF